MATRQKPTQSILLLIGDCYKRQENISFVQLVLFLKCAASRQIKSKVRLFLQPKQFCKLFAFVSASRKERNAHWQYGRDESYIITVAQFTLQTSIMEWKKEIVHETLKFVQKHWANLLQRVSARVMDDTNLLQLRCTRENQKLFSNTIPCRDAQSSAMKVNYGKCTNFLF